MLIYPAKLESEPSSTSILVYATNEGSGDIKHNKGSKIYPQNQVVLDCITRGIWKVLSMALYLSNRFTNPIMFGIILKSYLSSMLWHNFNEYIIMQTRKILL